MSGGSSPIEVVAAVVIIAGRVLLCQRHDEVHLPLLWEFPGGKIDPGESPRAALSRELEEELGVRSTIGTLVSRVEHDYPEKTVRIRFFHAVIDGDPQPIVHRQVRWIRRDRLAEYAVPPANQGVVDLLGQALFGEPSLH